jgi:outer membrane lipopolysaccharide assembly protein LptE/RlpB
MNLFGTDEANTNLKEHRHKQSSKESNLTILPKNILQKNETEIGKEHANTKEDLMKLVLRQVSKINIKASIKQTKKLNHALFEQEGQKAQ